MDLTDISYTLELPELAEVRQLAANALRIENSINKSQQLTWEEFAYLVAFKNSQISQLQISEQFHKEQWQQ